MARTKGNNPNHLWNARFELAKNYYIESKHLLIPDNYCIQGFALGRWIGTQRYEYVKRTNPYFTQERIDKLEAIGMIWDVKKSAWQDMFRELERYYHKNGTARVPQSFVTLEGKKLGIWLNKQRLDYRSGKLLLERQEAMEQLEVIWNPEHIRRQTWDSFFEMLIQYIHKHNGGFPPTGHVTTNGVNLGLWISNQRHHYNNGTLLPKRKIQLESIGFLGDALIQNWFFYYEQAVSYFEEYGHLCPMIDRGYTTIPEGLCSWLSQQRNAYHKGTIAIQKIEQLEAVGMVWDVRIHIWEQNYQQAADYYKKYGDLRISKNPNNFENSQLGQWLSTQRVNYRSRTNPEFTEERIRKLESIGMI